MLDLSDTDQAQWRISVVPHRFTDGEHLVPALDMVMRELFRVGPWSRDSVASESWHWMPSYEGWTLRVHQNGYGGYLEFRGATTTECLALRLADVVKINARITELGE
ncbi:MAG: hypothetical protein M1272_07895 [Firmicutes bacterium]|nr:hypothetical protein [Bacillota bacterium]